MKALHKVDCDGVWPMVPGLHKAVCIKRVGGQVDMSTLATHQGVRKQPHRKDGFGAGPSCAVERSSTPDGLIMSHQREMAGRV